MTRVMLIEDDQLLARQFMQVLARANYRTQHAVHAAEAMAMIDEQLPDVVILDMILPVTSGMTLLHELQSYGDTKEIPVVVCSSLVDSFSLDDLRPYGVRRLIDKTTMYPEDLITAVRAVI